MRTLLAWYSTSSPWHPLLLGRRRWSSILLRAQAQNPSRNAGSGTFLTIYPRDERLVQGQLGNLSRTSMVCSGHETAGRRKTCKEPGLIARSCSLDVSEPLPDFESLKTLVCWRRAARCPLVLLCYCLQPTLESRRPPWRQISDTPAESGALIAKLGSQCLALRVSG